MNTDQHFGTLLKRVFYLWHQVINERLRPRDVSHSQWRVVLELSRSPTPMTQTALAAELGVESPTIVGLLDRLAKKGWLVREACPADRRARLVRLTPRALRLARELEVVVGDVRRELLHDLGVAELAGCIAALSKIEARALGALEVSRRRNLAAPVVVRAGSSRAKTPRAKTVAPRSAAARRSLAQQPRAPR